MLQASLLAIWIYIGRDRKLTAKQVTAVRKAALEAGLDYTSSVDGRGFKFFFEGGDYDAFLTQVSGVAKTAKMTEVTQYDTRSVFHESKDYLAGGNRPGERQAWHQESGSGPSDLFRRVVDNLVVPYAKAVAAEGYRFSPDRFSRQFGLTESQQSYITDALRPKRGVKLSSVPLMTGKDSVTLPPTTANKPSVTDVMWALQNRAAQNGQIAPGDFSDQSLRIISRALADEIIYHTSQTEGKSAIGWYDRALKAAKALYVKLFPQLHINKDRALAFEAFLGITSQGADVYTNSLNATRMYHLVSRGGMDIPAAVKTLKGTFGKETNAIENNLLKFHELVKRNGYDKMREMFNTTRTVSEK